MVTDKDCSYKYIMGHFLPSGDVNYQAVFASGPPMTSPVLGAGIWAIQSFGT